MSTVFLAWQRSPKATDPRHRAWYPIGRLDRESAGYRFAYTKGITRAQSDAGFQPLVTFPKFEQEYRSTQLFSLFQNRVFNDRREDYSDLMARHDLGPDTKDPMKILAVSGGERQTDHLEVFPKIELDPTRGFSCRFFAHGVRHLSSASHKRIENLHADDALQVTMEMNNPVSGAAIQLQSQDDYQMVGWAPRYLIEDLSKAMTEHPVLRARVVRNNPIPAPPNQRLLVELSGQFPEGVEPMAGADFQPLV